MGITMKTFDTYCRKYFDNAKKILELGAQDYIVNKESIGYFKNVFLRYPITSFDMNGENNSIQVNLADEQVTDSTYDLVTNFGTSEHVPNQYICWKNIHAYCSLGGIIINELPRIGHWPNHCKYYVDKPFFESLNKDFDIIEFRYIQYNAGDLCFCILKKKSNIFLTNQHELEKNIKVINDFEDKISFPGSRS